MSETLPKPSRVVLTLDRVADQRSAHVIRALRSDGQSAAVGVLAIPDDFDTCDQVISGANELAARLGILPLGHWRLTGPFGAPEFYAAEVVTGLTWLKFLTALGIDPENEAAMQVMFDV